MIKIIAIETQSLAAQHSVQAGDLLVSLNGHPVQDILDYRFMQAEEELHVQIRHGEEQISFSVEKEYDEDLGLEFEEMKIRSCPNNCIFCFIKQNPPGMRRAIYFCDEDYRYSFLYGNYITLSNVGEVDLERIIAMRLSPLYISVHATDVKVRRQIFRSRSDDDLMDKLAVLNKNRIEIHVQIVLIPDVNDGEILETTIRDLYRFRQSIRSVAIVPVGLTKHRKKSPQIRAVDAESARRVLDRSEEWQQQYTNLEDDAFVYPADEFFLLAGEPLPPTEYYASFYQIENGVGLVRDYLDAFKEQLPGLPQKIDVPRKLLFVTGEMAAPVLREQVAAKLNQIENLHIDVAAVRNHFFGETVRVAGLITGRDILEQLERPGEYDRIILPPRCVNTDGLLLDDLSPADLQQAFGVPVRVSNNDFKEIINFE